MNVAVVTGSRADYGLLQWPMKKLREDSFFSVAEWNIWGAPLEDAVRVVGGKISDSRPDLVILLGDRFEIMGAALACHLQRVPIAHIAGGDVTEGSYDDAMRDSISRMATIHFVTSTSAMARLSAAGYRNVHLVGNPGVDYIRHTPWRGERPYPDPYVVVAYYPETIDGTVDLEAVKEAIDGRTAIWIKCNPDRGSELIPEGQEFSHPHFLNLIAHCEEFIGNSSAMLYEAPELGVKTRMIGKRQRGRTIPWGDGLASQRIVNILKYCLP
jgi:UDP-N-acetylglucosamine 2-epimerase